jgi:hypothetical protein
MVEAISMSEQRYVQVTQRELELVREQVRALRSRVSELEAWRERAEERRVAQDGVIREIGERAADIDRRLEKFLSDLDANTGP